MRLTIGLLIVFQLCQTAVLAEDKQSRLICGYESCVKSDRDKLNIHVVAHSHDDVGWLKTVDQYYFGARMDIQYAGVQRIIDSVIDALDEDSSRRSELHALFERAGELPTGVGSVMDNHSVGPIGTYVILVSFIYVETAYLWKWWQHQNERRRETMRNLINEGRLEIIGGGWSMNDEAATHYHSLIDQYTWGFRRLNDTFGECARPKIGWQIDPFGHSREQASIFAQLGFDGLLINRIDYQDKEQRLKDKTMEFVWEGSSSLGRQANIFTTVLYNHYSAPTGFCFDIRCRDKPMINDTRNPDYNADQKVKEFLEFADKQALAHRTNNIIVTMGDDFNYMDAERYFSSLDKLISGINKLHGKRYKAFYSTPACYLKAVNEQNLTWTRKSDDFFPYANDYQSYWTGYYSSRPTLKFFERMGNNFLQVVKQLSVLTNSSDSRELQLFREIMGMMQHHDAVTGTEKQHVAENYAQLLHYNMMNGERLAAKALRKWAKKKAASKRAEFHTCLLLNISSCEHTSDNSKFVVTVYNPTSQPLTTYVRLPVRKSQYRVKDFNGRDITTQIVPIPEKVLKIPGRSSKASKELIFQAVNIAPFGYQSFYVNQTSGKVDDGLDQSAEQFIQINNQGSKVYVNGGGKISVTTPAGVEYKQSFEYYESWWGVFTSVSRSSGAYVFRPYCNCYTNPLGSKRSFRIFKGPLVQEIHHVVNDWVSQVVRIYNEEEYVEFDWLVGPIPVGFLYFIDYVGKEIIVKYSSNIKNKNEFYTDSNGREMLKRKLHHRPTWDVKLYETTSGNYYPVNVKISIEDEKAQRRMSVLTDRAQGGSSLNEGQIELMVHRRLLHDDSFGVGEALNEVAYGEGLVARGKHILIVGSLQSRDELFLREKEEAVKLSLRPWLFITPTQDSFEEWNQHYSMKGDGIVGNLPRNIRILTLEPWKDDSVLLRLEHLFEIDESPKYSVITQVAINDLFPNFNILSVVETTLGANQHLEENQRLKWMSKKETSKTEQEKLRTTKKERKKKITGENFIVNLKPMEIRTFIVRLSPGKKFNS